MIALTGATGFLGRHTAEALERAKLPFFCLTRTGSKKAPLQSSWQVREVDFLNEAALDKALRGTKVLVHILGLINGTEEELRTANITIAEKIFAAAKAAGVEKVVLVSSVAAGMRHGYYGQSKFEGEERLRASKLPYTILRPAFIYGTGDINNTGLMLRTLKRWPVIPLLGGGKFKIQPVYVGDVAAMILKSIQDPPRNRWYNIAGGAQVPLSEILYRLAEGIGVKRIFVPIPLAPLQAVMRVYIKIFPNTRLPAKQVLELDKHEAFDITETQRDLGFNPLSFEEGAKKMFGAV